jgi:hypothetical protein
MNTVTCYRPLGENELELVKESGFKKMATHITRAAYILPCYK